MLFSKFFLMPFSFVIAIVVPLQLTLETIHSLESKPIQLDKKLFSFPLLLLKYWVCAILYWETSIESLIDSIVPIGALMNLALYCIASNELVAGFQEHMKVLHLQRKQSDDLKKGTYADKFLFGKWTHFLVLKRAQSIKYTSSYLAHTFRVVTDTLVELLKPFCISHKTKKEPIQRPSFFEGYDLLNDVFESRT